MISIVYEVAKSYTRHVWNVHRMASCDHCSGCVSTFLGTFDKLTVAEDYMALLLEKDAKNRPLA